jgi:DedD protein
MAFFKFRKGGSDHAPVAPTSAPESLEGMRKRARHRLIGAAVLVLLGVIGFPLLFDSQPRPIAVDIAIEIPDKNKVKPLVAASVAPQAANPVVKPPAMTVPAVQTAATKPPVSLSPVATPEAPASRAPLAAPALKPAMLPDEMSEVKPAPKPSAKPVTQAEDAAKAQALLDGHDADKKPAASEGRYVVQIGAFSDVLKAREARQKLEKSGLKTYTQVVEPKEGRRIRVRVGPFASKQEADKVAEKIRKLELPAAILEL